MGSIILTSWKPQRALTPLFTWQSLGCYVTPVKLPWRMGPFNKFLKRHLIKGENIHSFFFFSSGSVKNEDSLDTSISLGFGKQSILLSWQTALSETDCLPRVCHTDSSMSDRKREALCNVIYMGNLKRNDTDELITKQKQTHRLRERTHGYHGGRIGGRDG